MAIKPIEILIKAKDEASGIFGSLQSKVVGVGVAIAGYFGLSAFVGAVKGAAELQAKLSEVQAVSGATAAEMVLLRNAAEQAGATTKFTATEGAQALGNLARAGLSAKDAIATLPAVLNLAQAGNIGLAEASEYVTKAVMGLGLGFADAGRVADVLAKGANASNTSVTGLAQALSYTAPIAKSVGLGLETTVAIIGKFADAGIDASRAGTALNAILSQFADPASKFKQELAGAGITTNNFEAALHQLAAAGPAGQKAILAVGTEAGPALRALLNQGMGALDELKGKLDNAAGSAAATAKVMQDNLDGAMLGLGSTWETVKNALATPVLPALQSGVEQLTGALRSAVSDGTIGKFGEAIATAFQAGIKWVREFMGTVDFAALTARMQAFAADANNTFTQIGEYASNAGNIVKTVYGVMSAGVGVVMGAVYGIAEAFAGVSSNIQSILASILSKLAKITFGGVSESFKAAAAEMKLSAEATGAVTEAFAKKSEEAFSSATKGAELARDGIAGLTSVTQTSSTEATVAAKAWNDLSAAERLAANEAKIAAGGIKELSAAEQVAANEAKIAAFKRQEAADTVRAAIAELKKEYEAALATGNWQLAAEKIQAIKKATDEAKSGVTDLRKKAEEEAALTAAAFTNMGIKTKSELKILANNAESDFNRIKSSGQATTEGLQTAFKNYAEKAIAANNGVATEALKSEAALRGIELQVDGTGKAIIKAMDGGTGAVRTFTREVGQSLEDIKAMGAALDAINARYGQSKADLAGKYSRPGEGPNRSVLTKDDLKGVDNTGLFSLQNKNASNTLTAADLATSQAAYNAAATNLDVYQKNWSVFSLEGARSIQESYNQARAILERVNSLSAQPEPARNNQLEDYKRQLKVAESTGQTNDVAEIKYYIDQLTKKSSGSTVLPDSKRSESTTYVSNITIPGVGTTALTFADANSQRAGEELLRKLAQAKGASI